jgi:hypothetical protein
MTRQEVIRHIVLQARSNGFDFRAWYRAYADPEWPGFDQAIERLCRGRNCYALLFSHEFAQSFWKAGLQMSFMVPAVSYPQRRKDGQVVIVHRRAFARRMLKADSWLYHLREMVEASHPLKYIRRFVVLQEDILAAQQSLPTDPEAGHPEAGQGQYGRHQEPSVDEQNPPIDPQMTSPQTQSAAEPAPAPKDREVSPIRENPPDTPERLIS